MFFQKYKEIALSDLDSAHKDHDVLVKELIQVYKDIGSEKKRANSIVEEASIFFDSISRAPFTIKSTIRIINEQKVQFTKTGEIRQKERNEKVAAGIIAAAAAVGGIKRVPKFHKYVDKKIVQKLISVFGKNILSLTFICIILVIASVFFLFCWTISNYLAGNNAKKTTLAIIKKTAELRQSHTTAIAQKQKIITQQDIVRRKLDQLSFLRGMKASELSDEHISALLELVEETRGLAASLNN